MATIDIVEGDTVEYVLYGKEVGQYYIPSKLAWNDVYRFSHADFYLIKRDIETQIGEIVKEWKNVPNSYGHLLYDPVSQLLTVDLCAIGVEQLEVTANLIEKSSGHNQRNIICRFN